MLEDFVVHMGAGGAATGAHLGDDLALADHIAGFYEVFLVVGVAGDKPVAMGNFHQVAIA